MGAQNSAVRWNDVKEEGGRDTLTHLHHLGSARQEVGSLSFVTKPGTKRGDKRCNVVGEQ